KNWSDHLGDKEYYNAYMHFYASQIDAHGPGKTLEKYVFSKEANLTTEAKQGPQMLDRFMSGLLHPMVHTGHWAEFHVPGMLAEGLALASTTPPNSPHLFPPDFFGCDTQQPGSVQYLLDQATTTIRRLSLNMPRSASPSSHTGGAHALDILHRMLHDPAFDAGKTCQPDSDDMFSSTMSSVGDRIRKYAKMWHVDSEREVPEKLEEVSWLATLVYGLGGWRKGKPFRSDFFLLHLVTSSVFISSLITHLTFASQSALLRAQVSVILGYWVSRGRPPIPIEDYYSYRFDPSSLIPKALGVHPDKSAIGVSKHGGTTNLSSNIWLPIIESSLNHPEAHLLKNQRALAHFDHLYGKTPQGYFEGKTELEGAELLDGTLFWRVALHTQKTLGWVREGVAQLQRSPGTIIKIPIISRFSTKSVYHQTLGLASSFFPPPRQSNHELTPKFWPGVSSESESKIANLLRINNEKHHIFFNDKGFHNHLNSHLLAAYALGCSPELLSAVYRLQKGHLKPAFQSPREITENNWMEHVGKWNYYNAYMHFYASQIEAHGPVNTLEKYIFSKEANLTPEGKRGPQMLDRFMSGLLHPMIHTGHWAEFHVPGILAEGLALASVTTAQSPHLFPPDFFDYETPLSQSSGQPMTGQATTTTRNLSLNNLRSSSPSTSVDGFHSFDILHRMLQDSTLAAGKTCEPHGESMFTDTMKSSGDRIREYTKLWQVNSEKEVPAKLEEVAWLATLAYGLGGWRKGKPFRSDFFLLHLLTSSIFISSLLTHLSFPSQSALLRAQVSVILGYWVSRGRPSMPTEDYYSSEFDPSSFIPNALQVRPDKSAIGLGKGGTSNLWLAIIESSLNHPVEHVLKTQRTLAHFDRLYGKTPQGYFGGKTELEGVELLDGTLFRRVALHTQKTLGWVREGESQGGFDRAGVGWDHLWD
ncbi:hypothetical protein FS837_012224, partial [Tulasnella sp. UAMH 9824]